MKTTMTEGTKIKTNTSNHGERGHITTIQQITTNSLGTTIYVMANGQRLGIDEFKKYKGDFLRIAKKYKSGDRVCTVARDGQRGGYLIWTGAVYEAQPRKKDGVLIWRRLKSENFGGTRSGNAPSQKFITELQEIASHDWTEVTHGQICN